jgi:hypothetical protein
MRVPKVGEYWYANSGTITAFVKIVAVSDSTIIAYLPKYGESISYSITTCTKDVKWEPNWFWRMLGYK